MDRVALDLGFIQIYWYSLFILFAILTAFFIIYKEARKQKLSENLLTDLVFYSILFGILGARIYYVLFNFNYYLSNPLEIFKIWNGGLAIHGGLLTALIFILGYCKHHKINSLKMLDIIVVGLIIGQSIGRWGNFFNSEAYGAITTLKALENLGLPNFIIDGMYILGEYRQPTFLYESLWCLLGFIIMLLVRKFYKNLKDGHLLSFYLIWYGIERLIVEYFRTDSLMLGAIKVAQLISLIFIIVGIMLIVKIQTKSKNENNNLYRKSNIMLNIKTNKNI